MHTAPVSMFMYRLLLSMHSELPMHSFTSLCISSLALDLHADERLQCMPLSSLSSVISMLDVTALPREPLSS